MSDQTYEDGTYEVPIMLSPEYVRPVHSELHMLIA
jgi:hypothetical protein